MDKSLVVVDAPASAGETRYRLLETIRQYALEKLLAAGEAPDHPGPAPGVLHAHGRGLGDQRVWQPVGGGGGWWPKLDMDLDNIRAGIEWSIASGKADCALRILGASVYFWFARGHQITEWNDSVQSALSRPEGRQRTLARAKALNGMGFWYWADLAPTDRRARTWKKRCPSGASWATIGTSPPPCGPWVCSRTSRATTPPPARCWRRAWRSGNDWGPRPAGRAPYR